MGGLFSRLKNFAFEEVIKSAEVNAELNNIINNLNPQTLNNYSANVSQMQVQTDPGVVGTESLAPSLAGELERLRFKLAQITGNTYWYQAPALSLAEANALLNAISGLPPNRIVSGTVQSPTDAQPMFVIPAGSSPNVTVKGTGTPLIVRIDGVQYSLIADTTITGLVTAPTTNNTALVNDATLTGDFFSTIRGEFGTSITIDTVGTEITSLVGKTAAFKINNGVDDEYFIAYVKSGTELTNIKRGYFFDNLEAPIPRITISDNDTITLMKLTWIFVKSDLTLEAVYTNPTYSYAQPSSPAVGDWWFDQGNNTWKRFTGSSWVAAAGHLVGCCIQDGTNCVGARSFEPYANYQIDNTIEINYLTNTSAGDKEMGGAVNVMGRLFQFSKDDIEWNITVNLESGYTEAASTMYFLYITENGDKKMSPVYPYLRPDLAGCAYHPYHLWRCVGMAWNNASSNIENAGSIQLCFDDELFVYGNFNANPASPHSQIRRFDTAQIKRGGSFSFVQSASLGDVVTIYWPGTWQISYQDGDAAGEWQGISRNASAAAQDNPLGSLTGAGIDSDGLLQAFNPTYGGKRHITTCQKLFVGDKIRFHMQSVSTNNSTTNFRMTRVAT